MCVWDKARRWVIYIKGNAAKRVFTGEHIGNGPRSRQVRPCQVSSWSAFSGIDHAAGTARDTIARAQNSFLFLFLSLPFLAFLHQLLHARHSSRGNNPVETRPVASKRKSHCAVREVHFSLVMGLPPLVPFLFSRYHTTDTHVLSKNTH